MTASLDVLLNIALRTTVVYLAVLVGLRLTGKRQLGQLSAFDFVLLLIIANAVQNAMVGPDTSLIGGLVAAAVLLLWHAVIDRVRRASRTAAKFLGGSAVLLIYRGKILHDHLTREHITSDELLQALREHGVGAIEDVRMAALEPDGAVSVIREDEMGAARPHHRIKAIRRGE
ncbi:MAG TPA: YetF domain-containing protein [Gemmatimonadales bacterium]|nr:YetF domain-containing protein [Gemmatimonadales bacterium]